MQYHIEQKFLCPGCGEIVSVLFCADHEVTVRDTGITDDNGKLAERQFKHATVCNRCGTAFSAFMRTRFYHNKTRVTGYDSGKPVVEEIGVAIP